MAGSNKRCWFTVKDFSKKNGGGKIPPKCWVWVQSWILFWKEPTFFKGFLGSWSIGNPLFSAVFLSAFRAKNSIFVFWAYKPATWRNHLGLKSCSSTCLEKVGMLCFLHCWSTKKTSSFLPCFFVRCSQWTNWIQIVSLGNQQKL